MKQFSRCRFNSSFFGERKRIARNPERRGRGSDERDQQSAKLDAAEKHALKESEQKSAVRKERRERRQELEAFSRVAEQIPLKALEDLCVRLMDETATMMTPEEIEKLPHIAERIETQAERLRILRAEFARRKDLDKLDIDKLEREAAIYKQEVQSIEKALQQVTHLLNEQPPAESTVRIGGVEVSAYHTSFALWHKRNAVLNKLRTIEMLLEQKKGDQR